MVPASPVCPSDAGTGGKVPVLAMADPSTIDLRRWMRRPLRRTGCRPYIEPASGSLHPPPLGRRPGSPERAAGHARICMILHAATGRCACRMCAPQARTCQAGSVPASRAHCSAEGHADVRRHRVPARSHGAPSGTFGEKSASDGLHHRRYAMASTPPRRGRRPAWPPHLAPACSGPRGATDGAVRREVTAVSGGNREPGERGSCDAGEAVIHPMHSGG